MSRVLTGSISSLIPACFSFGAANLRLSTKVRRTLSSATPSGALPARQLTCRQPSAVAYSMARPTPVLELAHAVGKDRDPALAAGPVAGREGVEDLRQAVLLQLLGGLLLREVVGEEVLDPLEAVLRGGREEVEEAVLGVEHGQVGVELRHWTVPPSARSPAPRSARSRIPWPRRSAAPSPRRRRCSALGRGRGSPRTR